VTPDGRRRLGRGEEGFTLIELLVAISIFGFVLMAMSRVFISAAESIGTQRLRTAATRVASQRLETLRSLPFTDLDAQAGQVTVTTPDGRAFPVVTAVSPIDAATGGGQTGGAVRQVTVTVSWLSKGTQRNVSYTTAIAPDVTDLTPAPVQSIGTVAMFPSPATADASGRLLDDIDVTVPLEGFPATTLVLLSWTNGDGTAGAKTITNSTASNWRGTIARTQLLASLGTAGKGELQFTASAGGLTSVYTLAVQRAVASPPAIATATIDRSPIIVATAGKTGSCAGRNLCVNTTDVTFTVTATGLDPTQDSVILQYQLYDGTFEEAALTPVATQWRLTVSKNTTKFFRSTATPFRFTATRAADAATASTTVLRAVST
jgi:prepilin-type N-terminal cleavage/methylation domain-containing protein